MDQTLTLTATEFKAKCLAILDRLAAHDLAQVSVTKRGRVVAVLKPPPRSEEAAERLFGFMKGSVQLHPDIDLTEPVFEGEMLAAQGILHT